MRKTEGVSVLFVAALLLMGIFPCSGAEHALPDIVKKVERSVVLIITENEQG